MSNKLSMCCGAPPSEYFGVCSKCREHTGFKELCGTCEDPCLLDGQPIDENPVTYVDMYYWEEVHHASCYDEYVSTHT